ncbi:MAG: CoA transferase [Sandaracinaceae bacterium]|nr:CoA transferase [Sandaracinaceae bacterium]
MTSEESSQPEASGPLRGVRVLDLSRVLAGPTCTQTLGDLGADVVKLERPGAGDDTRGWGPPFVHDADGARTDLSAYFLAANRNKRSIAIDLASDEGVALTQRLVAKADVVVENFKVGDLARRGLDAASLLAAHPHLVVCSITGFGQTGPRAGEAGYDFLAQAMGGLMSLTGEIDGAPTKVGVGIADVVTGLYATIGVLAALAEVRRTGRGQHVDVALYDAQLAWLVNAATTTFLTGAPPRRHGNAHPSIVPYQTFPSADGEVALACGNDGQFATLAEVLGEPALAADARFATNRGRVEHREALVPILARLFRARPTEAWIDALVPRGVPIGPVRTVAEAFADPQAIARAMRVEMPSALAASGHVSLIGSPIKLSETPVAYRTSPPSLGEHGPEVLRDWLGVDDAELAALAMRGAFRSRR